MPRPSTRSTPSLADSRAWTFTAMSDLTDEERRQALVEGLFPRPIEEQAVDDQGQAATDFDAGVRASPELKTPEQAAREHNETLLELIRDAPTGQGGEW